MNSWKTAKDLAFFEIKNSWLHRLLLLSLSGGIMLIITLGAFQHYFENSTMGIDIFFILIIFYSYAWAVPKPFQYQKISDENYASPVFIFLHQLAIKNEVLIKSRFIIFFTMILPYLIIFISLLYISPQLRGILDVTSFISFVILWVSVGLAFGAVFPASDLGDVNVTTEKLLLYIFLLIIGVGVVFAFAYALYGNGIIHFTTYLAAQWPLLTAIGSILTAIVSVLFWWKHALKKIQVIDFLN
ncbi:hypothetical protein E3U55_13285 [Filobacillus milosensis]|uniref:ABC-2 transporter permease n=1 Tax=Filobacillus milosensis TaxID=94137 RepID=A0A4Y8IE81_9BACI|nr:hypothetical protein [Filobacillus milosensis]TFB14598.1 hypothetical protein E3U55_13285 [Filobacillus milosensis]